jgi:HAD superfamily hydrolase (TIGR01484 family)
MNKYKLLVLDVDGTLIKDGTQNISKKVIKSIKDLKDKVIVILCTGRSLQDLGEVISNLDLQNNYHIIESGAKVLSPGLNVELVRSLKKEDVSNLISMSKDICKKYSICVEGKWIYDFTEVADEEDITTLSFYVDAEDAESAKKHFSIYENVYHINITTQWGNPNGRQIMITHPEATKEKSLEYVQNKLGISIDETASIGDMPSDLPMFKRSGLKIAVMNADQKLKDVADEVVASVDNDVVYDAIKKFILN